MPESPTTGPGRLLDKENRQRRPIRSFVIRSGRMTDAQRAALQQHMQRWALPLAQQPTDFAASFGNTHPLVLEIGFGMGDSLASMAAANPQQNFIGVEVHQAGVGRLLALVEKQQLQNVRVYCHDAVEVLSKNIAVASLDRVNIYFPDPWHKKRHHKRRLVQPSFLTLLHSRLKQGGLLHIATDWQAYAEHVLEIIEESTDFYNVATPAQFVAAKDYGRPETKFERRGLKLGHGVWDMVFQSR
ncbi:MAG: tRNA (guanosine(46)-N7)-methyltransferase TrmB [Pseudomonadales bacterium]|nr:tRNA (guanosine(46)-N7)-methyltransferase TrmB [Pseudomonadales bacterium]